MLNKVSPPHPAQLRNGNRASVLRLIAQRSPIARTEIAASLGLSSATVTGITRELIDAGVVEVVEQAPSRGGRPALRLGLVAGVANAVGVKLADDHAVAVRVDLHGRVLATESVAVDPRAGDLVERLVEFLEPVASAGEADVLLGLGLGLPGIVSAQAGGLVTSPMLGLAAVPLASRLEERLGLPVLIDNDVNTLAVAERLYSRGRDAENFVALTLGRGVGVGLVLGGELYRGRGGAGELGHVVVDPAGPLCECGNRGCLEALVADPALVARGRAAGLLGGREGIDRLRALAAGSDPRAAAVFAEAGETLGRAVAGIVDLLDPQLVIVSGEGIASWPYLERSFSAALDAATFAPLRGGVRIEVDPWDDAKWARGAAALVLRAPFTPVADPATEDVRERLHNRAGAVA